MKPIKFKAHFNRINMQRGNPNVWTVHDIDNSYDDYLLRLWLLFV